jgi:hypothetical protein
MSTTAADNAALFPITADERIAKVRRGLEIALEQAEKRADKAGTKVARAMAELDEFDAAIDAVRGEHE